MTKPLQFRPHHFLCALAYRGIGYSPAFVANFDAVAAQIRGNEQTPIQVKQGLDIICSACPHNRQMKTCTSEAKVQALDKAHAQILELHPGDTLTFKEAKLKLKQKMTIPKFKEACAPCEWQSLGICEEALLGLLAEK